MNITNTLPTFSLNSNNANNIYLAKTKLYFDFRRRCSDDRITIGDYIMIRGNGTVLEEHEDSDNVGLIARLTKIEKFDNETKTDIDWGAYDHKGFYRYYFEDPVLISKALVIELRQYIDNKSKSPSMAGIGYYKYPDAVVVDIDVHIESVTHVVTDEIEAPIVENEHIVVYAIRSPAWPTLVKIGKTKDLSKRLKQLNGTNIPKSFQYNVEHIIETRYSSNLEKLIHVFFDEYRDTKDREFFHVDTDKVKQFFSILEAVKN